MYIMPILLGHICNRYKLRRFAFVLSVVLVPPISKSLSDIDVSRISCAMHQTQRVSRWKNILETESCLLVISINHDYYSQIPVKLYNVLTLPLVSPTLSKLMYSDIGS